MIKGEVRDQISKEPLQGVQLRLEPSGLLIETGKAGQFLLQTDFVQNLILHLLLDPYRTLSIPLEPDKSILDLGIIFMEIDVGQVLSEGQLVLSEADLEPGDEASWNTGFLGAGNDLLTRRAAFDFSQVFFRMRGYDSRSRVVMINGIPMNRMLRGRPQWNNWGGLNDVFRNQEVSLGLSSSPDHFGDVLGVTSINSRPGLLRQGLRISSSMSNKTYTGRVMATFNKTSEEQGWGYTISGSGRWSKEGYIDGTGYDAYSAFGSLEYQFNKDSSIYLTAFVASNIRGRSAAITQEVFELVGSRYNPYWGIQDSRIRNSRIRHIREPLIMLNFDHRGSKLDIKAGIAYQWGTQKYSRIGYFDAPNPLPDYYRYLPSYYINSPIGANFIGAETASQAFRKDPQINWTALYQSNLANTTKGKAAYVLYDDISEESTLRGHCSTNLKLGKHNYLDIGFNYYNAEAAYYALIKDLLGGGFHEDIDPFSDTLNDLEGALVKMENEQFGYHYQINAHQIDFYAQLRYVFREWNGFLSAKYYQNSFAREGLYRNGRFPENSLGTSESVNFTNHGFKAGISYEFNKRHRMEANAMYAFRPPVLSNIFINPRENNEIVNDLSDEKISSADLNYVFRWPKLSGRLSAFYTRFQHITDINFFFVDSGVGSDFVQQLTTGLDRLHKGVECGIEFRPSSTVTLTAAASISEYLYANDPRVSINFDTAGPEEDLINLVGQKDLGLADLQDDKLSRGPSQAVSLGIEYRDPKYWWVSGTINRLSDNYIDITHITRTSSFRIDPETGKHFPNATDENVAAFLKQEPLPEVYLLNMTAGKSWLWKGKYISVFLGISNLLNTVFKTGGYEQSRNGNFKQVSEDNLSGSPSFGPKYWFGYGRTFFLNLAISL